MRGEDVPVTPGEEMGRKKKRKSLLVRNVNADDADATFKRGGSGPLLNVQSEIVESIQPKEQALAYGTVRPGSDDHNDDDDVFPDSPVKSVEVEQAKPSSAFHGTSDDINQRRPDNFKPLFGEPSPPHFRGRYSGGVPSRTKRILAPSELTTPSLSATNPEFVLPSRKQKPNDVSGVNLSESSLRPPHEALGHNIRDSLVRYRSSSDANMDPPQHSSFQDNGLDRDNEQNVLQPSMSIRPIQLRPPSPPETLDMPTNGMAHHGVPKPPGMAMGLPKRMKPVKDYGGAETVVSGIAPDLGMTQGHDDDEDDDAGMLLSPINVSWNYMGTVEIPLPRLVHSVLGWHKHSSSVSLIYLF